MPTTRLRCVFDTNVLISAALFGDSQPGRALRWALTNGVLLASAETLTELAEVLGRSKLDRYLSWEERETFLRAFADRVEIIEPAVRFAVCRDPDDDRCWNWRLQGALTRSSPATWTSSSSPPFGAYRSLRQPPSCAGLAVCRRF